MPKPIISGPYRTFRRLNPDESFLEFEGSTITIPMKGRRSPNDPWMEDEIKLKAFMRLEIFPPYVNNLRTREFQFIIRDWYLYGKSLMLNRLFFDDPRGFWLGDATKGKYNDYAPAVVTFRVSNNYDVRIFDGGSLKVCDIFGPTNTLEVKHLTSHDLRTWVDLPEREEGLLYSLAQNVIYWQIMSPTLLDDNKDLGDLIGDRSTGPLIVFHKKPAGESQDTFDLTDARERTEYLLAIASVAPEKLHDDGSVAITARAPRVGGPSRLRNMQVQLPGNTVVSPLYRPRRPLEIVWRFAAGVDLAKLIDTADKATEGRLSGVIRIVSPSRSLGTADQGPDVGDPIDSADFPARLTYAINYNISVNQEEFVEDQAGIAIAVGALEVPPRDVTVAFDKPHVGRVLSQYLEFGPGHCTGMHEITQGEYNAGVNFSRYWRTVPLDPTDSAWADFEDYDPQTEY